MNEFTVLGIRNYSFTDDKTGNFVNGYSLYVSQPFNSQYSAGVECTKISISVDLFNALNLSMNELIGKKVNIFYNNRGKVQSISLTK